MKKITILEATLRDGSYLIDFKFTLHDTAMLANILCGLGFNYIEVGHGLGLGASRAGKGKAPWSDEESIRTAKTAVGKKALIGSFFIPGIGDFNDLRKAKEAELDFVRIGQNVTEMENALPFIKEALKLGIVPMVNFMKSYALSPEALAVKAEMVADAGAEVIYIVDSAGGMLPRDVAGYFDTLRNKLSGKVKLGFHGHNNLSMAAANSLAAIEHGASFVDTTLYGMGRSAGNAPTEIIVAILTRLGFDLGGINLFEVMDIVEEFVQPLVSRIPMYNMLSVVGGYSFFHSSFLPEVSKVAGKYGVELKKLVAAAGLADPVHCKGDVLRESALKLAKEKQDKHKKDFSLTTFKAPGISPHKISSTLQEVKTFMDNLEITASKTWGISILDLAPLSYEDDQAALPEFLLQDDKSVIGRIYYGSQEILKEILEIARGKISWLIADTDNLSSAGFLGLSKVMKETWNADHINFYSAFNLQINYYLKIILSAARLERKKILFYGKNRLLESLRGKLTPFCEEVCFFEKPNSADILVCFIPPASEDVEGLLKLIGPDGVLVAVDNNLGNEMSREAKGKGIKVIDVNPFGAYEGFSSRLFFHRENCGL